MKNAMIVALVVGTAVSAASAQTRTFNWTRAQGGQNDGAGVLASVTNSYNPATDQFSFTAQFNNRTANGFWLAVSPGPNPKGHSGELALIYFDGSNIAAPRATVYAYNGLNGDNSFQDGTARSGTQTPDFIGALINGVNATMAVTNTSGGGRSLSISFDGTFVQTHQPLDAIDRARNEWTGLAFGAQYGIWFHPVSGLSTAYNNTGRLTQWHYDGQGWLDLANQTTIPTPGAAAVLGLGALGAARRRRK